LPRRTESRDDSDEPDAVVKHLSQREEEEADSDYMNDVEAR